MTFLEKFLAEHPDKTASHALTDCPHRLGYEGAEIEIGCIHGALTCADCWNREMPETKNTEKENENMSTKQDFKPTEEELLEKIRRLNKDLDRLNRYKKYEDCANELKAALDAMMDAGFTREEAMSIILASAKR